MKNNMQNFLQARGFRGWEAVRLSRSTEQEIRLALEREERKTTITREEYIAIRRQELEAEERIFGATEEGIDELVGLNSVSERWVQVVRDRAQKRAKALRQVLAELSTNEPTNAAAPH